MRKYWNMNSPSTIHFDILTCILARASMANFNLPSVHTRTVACVSWKSNLFLVFTWLQRIKNFEFYIHQVKVINKTISGPDFSLVACFLFEMDFRIFSHRWPLDCFWELWLVIYPKLSIRLKFFYVFKNQCVTSSIYTIVFKFSREKKCFAGGSHIKLQIFPLLSCQPT